MASKTSPIEQRQPVIDMAELGARLAARKAALGEPELPRNAGANRTPSKRVCSRRLRMLAESDEERRARLVGACLHRQPGRPPPRPAGKGLTPPFDASTSSARSASG